MNEQLQVSLNYRCICLSYQNDYLNWHNRLFLANHSAWVYLWLHIWITQWIVKIWLWILIYNTINIAIKHFPTNDKIFWKNKYHNYVIKTTVKWKLFVVCYKNNNIYTCNTAFVSKWHKWENRKVLNCLVPLYDSWWKVFPYFINVWSVDMYVLTC